MPQYDRNTFYTADLEKARMRTAACRCLVPVTAGLSCNIQLACTVEYLRGRDGVAELLA